MERVYGGIEAGGTKFLCAVGRGPDVVLAEERIPTTTPLETIGRAIAFFRKQEAAFGPMAALGIGTFGPVDLDPTSPRFGWITSTPKPGWADTDLRSPFLDAFQVPVAIDTDVGASAVGEGLWGAARELDTFLYMTIGTGIGGAAIVNGTPLHGLLHPEMGHMRIPHDRTADPFDGVCPFHGDCLEGMATGPALERRWSASPPSLPPDHPAWRLEAHYLALALVNLICIISPQRIILGGGVMSQASLLPRIRADVLELLHGYVQAPAVLEAIGEYIVPPALGGRSGILGALALASLLPE
jgi:fructokinase